MVKKEGDLMQGFINLWEILELNVFEPLEASLGGFQWVSQMLNLISNLLTTIFNYEIMITEQHLAAAITLTLVIVCLSVVIKLFVTAFSTISNSLYENKRKRRRR